MDRFTKMMATALMVAAVAATGASAATPAAGKFRGVTSQTDHTAGPHRVTLRVSKRNARARVTGAVVQFTLRCEDGTSVARTAYVPGGEVTRSGRFNLSTTSGESYGPDGRISLRLSMSGRFAGARRAEGTFDATATVSASTLSPAVACSSGTVGWVGSRAG
jgi:hypothetical protein